MSGHNPYTLSFGKIPTEYIGRTVIIESIMDALTSEHIDAQAFKITGMRGTGKTVTLTNIEKRCREKGDFYVVDLNSNRNIITELVANLYSEVPSIAKFIDANLNLSAFGIGIGVSRKTPVVSMDVALKKLATEIMQRKKRLLIVIDEARKTPDMIDFIQSFQILVRNDLPVFLVIAGLYEDIDAIENSDGTTFFLRAEKYEMTPLNLTYITDSYRKNLSVSREEAEKLAHMTKGYAFAYQVLGKYMWDAKAKSVSDTVLQQFDDTLSEKVYKKIWSELAPKDRYFLQFIVQKDIIPVQELLEAAKQSHSAWSVPRKRLKDKGIIDLSTRGIIQICLPRFKEFVEMQNLLDQVV